MTSNIVPVPTGSEIAHVYHGCTIRELSQDTPASLWPTSLDITDTHERAILFATANPGDIDFDGDKPLVVRAVNWVIMPDSAEDPETGEVRTFGRLILIERDGRFFRTTSAFGPMRLKAALELYGPAEWAQGVSFIIRRRVSKRGRTYHDIRIAPME